jgi:hypothetical protein
MNLKKAYPKHSPAPQRISDMILNGSQRGGAYNLANHLLNDQENDHVTVYELRGTIARDLHGALSESYAISKGTKCDQFMFSLSINPPKNQDASEQDLLDAVERAEKKMGLDNQPRAIIFHEKEGRRHAHVVWSRIKSSEMKAINLSHYKAKLTSLSRQLFLDHGWDLPNGLRHDGGKSPLNFTLDEWQQAKRLGLDPREIKQSFHDASQISDNPTSFQHALEDKGYFLARGDRRGFVALNIKGEVFSVPRMLNMKTKEIRSKLGDPDELRSVDETKAIIKDKVNDHIHSYIDQVDAKHKQDFEPLNTRKLEMRVHHRQERVILKAKQKKRWKQETRERANRHSKGMRGLWDRVAGNYAKIKQENELEAWNALKHDQEQRDHLVKSQMQDRRTLQRDIDKLRRKHTQNRAILARDIAQTIRMSEHNARMQTQERQRSIDQNYRGPSL